LAKINALTKINHAAGWRHHDVERPADLDRVAATTPKAVETIASRSRVTRERVETRR
jgi:hypothetical protein